MNLIFLKLFLISFTSDSLAMIHFIIIIIIPFIIISKRLHRDYLHFIYLFLTITIEQIKKKKEEIFLDTSDI